MGDTQFHCVNFSSIPKVKHQTSEAAGTASARGTPAPRAQALGVHGGHACSPGRQVHAGGGQAARSPRPPPRKALAPSPGRSVLEGSALPLSPTPPGGGTGTARATSQEPRGRGAAGRARSDPADAPGFGSGSAGAFQRLGIGAFPRAGRTGLTAGVWARGGGVPLRHTPGTGEDDARGGRCCSLEQGPPMPRPRRGPLEAVGVALPTGGGRPASPPAKQEAKPPGSATWPARGAARGPGTAQAPRPPAAPLASRAVPLCPVPGTLHFHPRSSSEDGRPGDLHDPGLAGVRCARQPPGRLGLQAGPCGLPAAPAFGTRSPHGSLRTGTRAGHADAPDARLGPRSDASGGRVACRATAARVPGHPSAQEPLAARPHVPGALGTTVALSVGWGLARRGAGFRSPRRF